MNTKKLTVTLQGAECDRYKRMFEDTCVALGEIGDALGCAPNEGGSGSILEAIAGLKESAKATVPSVESAHAMGAKGAEPIEAERLLFEAWMRGHCWALSSHWDGKQYVSDDEVNGGFSAHAMGTRRLWAAWRDRAALSSPPCPVESPTESIAHGNTKSNG
jgi:hypothetical protein